MKKPTLNKVLILISSALLSACAATQSSERTVSVAPTSTASSQEIVKPVLEVAKSDSEITLEKIMSHPDWMGRQPQNPTWADDSKSIFFAQKREGSELQDWFGLNLSKPSETDSQIIPLSQKHLVAGANKIANRTQTYSAWSFKGSIYLKNLSTQQLQVVAQGQGSVSNLMFIEDNSLAYRVADKFVLVDIKTGFSRQVVEWKFAEAPKGVKAANDYIEEQQHELIDYIALQRKNKDEGFKYSQNLINVNNTLAKQPFYFKKGFKTANASLSPDASKMLLAIAEDKPTRSDGDIMPNYIKEDGRIFSEKVRRRVADAKPEGQELWLLDLENGTSTQLSYSVLPGYNEDVLEDVKRENAKRKGEDYQTNRLPREIGLINDWYWSQSPFAWYHDGSEVAVMLEAWDNKDRWIATVDLEKAKLVNQHRLHDEAWINYKFNSFGWFNNKKELYFLSEESGYANLYTKNLTEKAESLVSGKFEVDELTLTRDDQYIYFQANKVHPGIYDIYRVNTDSGNQEQITQLLGMTTYVLSPDESNLLLTHSKITQPPELYLQSATPGAEATRLTHTVSDEFNALPWTVPQIVPVPSSNTSEPIYSKVYLPADYQVGEKRRAVVFNHGAGYLQNSHMGWSGYFREFMFHSMLAQQGYVVLDMDYRASKGYGRDWRTAIYRHMGKPETEDLVDGVNWLVENANVDRERIGTYGGSYGGFMTFMALFTEPELFQAGAALRPVTDWAHYNHPYTSNILNTPDIDPIAYERSSPIYFAEGLNKPLLINAPMVDDNVFFVDVVRLVQRLIELEKQDFETAIYPVEPHGFKQPSSWLDEYRRIYKLFERYL